MRNQSSKTTPCKVLATFLCLAVMLGIVTGATFSDTGTVVLSQEALDEIAEIETAFAEYPELFEQFPETKALFDDFLVKLYSGDYQRVDVPVDDVQGQEHTGTYAKSSLPSLISTRNIGLQFDSGNVRYEVAAGSTVTVVGLSSDNPNFAGDLMIPATVTHLGVTYSVTRIELGAFANSKITSVDIPASVANIGVLAFADCDQLKTLTFRRSDAPVLQKFDKVTPFATDRIALSTFERINVPCGRLHKYYNSFDNMIFTGLDDTHQLAGICTNTPTLTPCTTNQCANKSFRKGDVDGNGVINTTDSLETLIFVAKMPASIITKQGRNSNQWDAALVTAASINSSNPTPVEADVQRILLAASENWQYIPIS